jgi:hypothetical protein
MSWNTIKLIISFITLSYPLVTIWHWLSCDWNGHSNSIKYKKKHKFVGNINILYISTFLKSILRVILNKIKLRTT